MTGKHIAAALALGACLLSPASPSRAQAPAPADATQGFLFKPNFPVSDQLPTEPSPRLLDGLALAPGAVSKAAMVFTPGGTTDTRAKLDAQVYYNAIFGNQLVTTGNDGIEGDTASNFTRIRRYDPASPYNLLNFTPTGLNMGVICSMNDTPAGCTQSHVYGALIRLPTVILPGDIVSLTMRTGNSPMFYTGAAMYAAVQLTPGPGGNPYADGGPHYARCYAEIDGTDNYLEAGVPVGHQLKMGAEAKATYAENKDGQCYHVAPHQVYDANGEHFVFHTNHGHPFSATRTIATYDGMHTYTWWLTDDGSNLIHYFFDGMLVSTQYYESRLSTYKDKDGTVRPVGYSLVIAAQTIPVFLNANQDTHTGLYADIKPNDGGPIVGGAWSATIQAIKILRGSITPAALARATVDPNGSNGAAYNGLKDYAPR